MKEIFISDLQMQIEFTDPYGNRRMGLISDYLDKKAGFKAKLIKTSAYLLIISSGG